MIWTNPRPLWPCGRRSPWASALNDCQQRAASFSTTNGTHSNPGARRTESSASYFEICSLTSIMPAGSFVHQIPRGCSHPTRSPMGRGPRSARGGEPIGFEGDGEVILLLIFESRPSLSSFRATRSKTDSDFRRRASRDPAGSGALMGPICLSAGRDLRSITPRPPGRIMNPMRLKYVVDLTLRPQN